MGRHIIFGNYATTTLSSATTAIATTMVVNSSSTFPTITAGSYFYATIIDRASYLARTNPPLQREIVKVTALSGSTYTVIRAQEGTTAWAWSAGDYIELRVTARTLYDLQGKYNVAHYGATGDGTTNDVAAINLAIADVNLAGGTLYFPEGTYYVPTALNAITAENVVIEGAGKDLSCLSASAGSVITIGSAGTTAAGCTIRDLLFHYNAAPGAAAVCINLLNCSNVNISDIHVEDAGIVMQMGVAGGTSASVTLASKISGYVYDQGVPAFNFLAGSGFFLTDCSLFVDTANVTFPAVPATTANRFVFNFVNSWDTAVFTNCLFDLFDVGYNIAPTGTNVIFGIFATNVIMDGVKRWGLYVGPTVNAIVSTMEFNGCYFQGYDEDGIIIAGAGTVGAVNFNGGRVFFCAKNGVSITNTAIRHINFTGMQVYGVNGDAGAYDGFQIAAGVGRFAITGCKIGWNTATVLGTNYSPRYAISLGIDCDFYSITGCTTNGSTSGMLVADNTAGSTQRVIANTGPILLYQGTTNLTGGIYIVPASTVLFTNTTPFRLQVHIRGGTVSAIKKNTVTITSATTADLVLGPGETFSTTNTGAPDITYFGIPN